MLERIQTASQDEGPEEDHAPPQGFPIFFRYEDPPSNAKNLNRTHRIVSGLWDSLVEKYIIKSTVLQLQ